MELSPHVQAVLADLEAQAPGEPEAAEAFERSIRAIEPSLQLRLLDVLSQAALELSPALPAGRVEVRLAGRDAQLVYVADEAEAPAPEPEEAGTARITLRLPEGLKARVETSASSEGVSVNAWLVRAASRSLEAAKPRRTGRRITGYAES